MKASVLAVVIAVSYEEQPQRILLAQLRLQLVKYRLDRVSIGRLDLGTFDRSTLGLSTLSRVLRDQNMHVILLYAYSAQPVVRGIHMGTKLRCVFFVTCQPYQNDGMPRQRTPQPASSPLLPASGRGKGPGPTTKSSTQGINR